MNKKQAEKAIRGLATAVCVKHDVPDQAVMDELAESGYKLERLKLAYLDGLRVEYPDGSMWFATHVQTRDGRQNRCTIYAMEDVQTFESCTRMLVEAERPSMVYAADCYADGIASDGLRNQIKEACAQMRKSMSDAGLEDVQPDADPGQDDDTPLECYEGFEPEPIERRPMPVENAYEWVKRPHDGLTIERKNEKACWWVSGDTKPRRELLKAMGFRWAPKKKKWYLRPQVA